MGPNHGKLVLTKTSYQEVSPLSAIDHTMNVLVVLTQGLPIGTNLALLHFLWMLVSGALLPQRGALFPALQSMGLSEQATRRAWTAFRCGAWQTAVILRLWQEQIEGLPGWQVQSHEGYRAITVDVTAFWRADCPWGNRCTCRSSDANGDSFNPQIQSNRTNRAPWSTL